MENIISIHDNEVHSYHFQLPQKNLIINTAYKDEKTDIKFTDVLAYSFENAGEQNILFEVVQSSIEGFVRWYATHAEAQKAFEYGYPLTNINSPDALLAFLKKESYNYYEVNASVGLDGFVLAKKMEFLRKI